MFTLIDISVDTPADATPPDGMTHLMTFTLSFTIYDVPDDFTGTVYTDTNDNLYLEHYNKPKGNRRKMFTLKNKLVPGTFRKIESCIFAVARGESIKLPQSFEAKKLSSRSMGG